MKDNFDIYEYRDQLKSKQIKETLTGMDASNKIIAYLRDNIYPKLDDDGMDEFVIEMCNHFDVEPPNYRLPEGTGPRQKVVALDDLTFDQLGPKPMFGFDAQNNDDSSSVLHNDDDLKRWKDGIMGKYGNVDIKVDLDASDEIQVMDKQFQDDKESYTQRKGRALKDMGTNV